MEYKLYTDGACQPNPGTGGWAFLILHEQGQFSKSGGEKNTTNNRMELMAVINGMLHYSEHFWTDSSKLLIVSDSKYLINGILSWCKKWNDNDWVKADGKPVLNSDLWKRILSLSEMLQPKCQHVKGHSGHVYNEKVDQMAQHAINGVK